MSQKIKFVVLRCTSANRTSYTPDAGEFLYETNTKNVYMGDGSTAGGVLLGGGSGGESNTASNVGTSGVGVFKQKTGIDLEFKKINAANNKITITDDTGNNEVDIGIAEANFTEVVLKSLFNAKGDIVSATADDTPAILSVGTDGYELVADSGETTGLKWQEHRPRAQMKAAAKNSNYTVLTTDQVVFVDTTSGDITITLPLSTAYPADGYLYECWIKHGGGSNNVIIQLSGSEVFAQGHDKVVLTNIREVYHCGAMNGGGWSNVTGIHVIEQLGRDASWAASNFTSYTGIPWDVEDIHDNDSIMDNDIGGSNPGRITCKIAGRYRIAYHIEIDSTGGSTWTINSRIRVNGTTTVAGSEVRTGNYGGEDGNLACPCVVYELAANDYVELEVIHSSLTGNIDTATITVETEI